MTSFELMLLKVMFMPTVGPHSKVMVQIYHVVVVVTLVVVVVIMLISFKGWDMAEDHGAPEAGKLSISWTRGRSGTERRQRVSGVKSP